MRLFRLTRRIHADLTGAGGLKGPARWHEMGHPVVYLTTSRPLAILEMRVHHSVAPLDFVMIEVAVPKGLIDRSLSPKQLPRDWIARAEITREVGTQWLRSQKSALFRVPSAIVPEEHNFLLNPRHPNARKVKIVDIRPFEFDGRLWLVRKPS